MPDLVGKQYEEAFNLLSQYNVAITKVAEISADPVGTVTDQEPVGGSPFSTQVTLTVSVAPATVPNVVDMTFGDAQLKLQGLGLKVVEVPEFDSAKADGLVIKQDPPSGTQNAGEVKLTVVRRPVELYLSDAEEINNQNAYNFTKGAARANGVDYSHAIGFSVSQHSSGYAEYDLSRDYRRLVGAVAFADDSPSDSVYKVEVYGDNRQLYADTVKFGETKPLKIDVTGILRIKISLTDTSGASGQNDPHLILGDVRAQGLPSEVVSPSPEPSPTES